MNKTQLAERPEHNVAVAPVAVEQMLLAGIEKGLTPEGIEKLVDLKLKLESIRAENEFNAAMVAFQSECPSIDKNRAAKDRHGKVMYSYSDLDHIKHTIQPILAKHGLSVSDDAKFTENAVEAVATAYHIGGHRRSSTFRAPIGGTDMMSNMQKSASALSFARRYALIQVLGLTTGDRDDDGQTAGAGELIDEEKAATLQALMEECIRNKPKFLQWLGVEKIADLPLIKYAQAVAECEKQRRK